MARTITLEEAYGLKPATPATPSAPAPKKRIITLNEAYGRKPMVVMPSMADIAAERRQPAHPFVGLEQPKPVKRVPIAAREPPERVTPEPTQGAIPSYLRSAAKTGVGILADIPKALATARAAGSLSRLSLYDRLDRNEPITDLAKTPTGQIDHTLLDILRTYASASPEGKAAIRKRDADLLDPRQNRLTDVATAMEMAGTKLAGEPDPARAEEFGTKVAEGVGSLAGFMLPGAAAGRALRIPGAVSAAGMGALVNAQSQFEDALRKGGSLETAFQAFAAGIPGGLTEAVPMARWLDRLDRATGGTVRRKLLTAAKEGGEELSQEWFQNLTNDAIARGLYDPQRDIAILPGEQEGIAGGLGAIMGLLTSALPGRQRGAEERPAAQPPAVDMQAAIAEGQRRMVQEPAAAPLAPVQAAQMPAAITPAAPTAPIPPQKPKRKAKASTPQQAASDLKASVEARTILQERNQDGHLDAQIAAIDRNIAEAETALRQPAAPAPQAPVREEAPAAPTQPPAETRATAPQKGFVVDEIDPDTGAVVSQRPFPQAKTQAQAIDAFDAAFPDESGPLRRGAVRPAAGEEQAAATPAAAMSPDEAARAFLTRPAPEANDELIRQAVQGATVAPLRTAYEAGQLDVFGTLGTLTALKHAPSVDTKAVDALARDIAQSGIAEIDELLRRPLQDARLRRQLGFARDDLVRTAEKFGAQAVPRIAPAAAPAVPSPLAAGTDLAKSSQIKPKHRAAPPPDLFQFIRENGGMRDDTGELLAIIGDKNHKFYRQLYNPQGLSDDHMRERAEEAGYLGEQNKDELFTRGPNDLYRAIDRQARGQTVYSTHDVSEVLARQARETAAEEQVRDKQAITEAQLVAQRNGGKLTREEAKTAAILMRSRGMTAEEAVAEVLDNSMLAAEGKAAQTIQKEPKRGRAIPFPAAADTARAHAARPEPTGAGPAVAGAEGGVAAGGEQRAGGRPDQAAARPAEPAPGAPDEAVAPQDWRGFIAGRNRRDLSRQEQERLAELLGVAADPRAIQNELDRLGYVPEATTRDDQALFQRSQRDDIEVLRESLAQEVGVAIRPDALRPARLAHDVSLSKIAEAFDKRIVGFSVQPGFERLKFFNGVILTNNPGVIYIRLDGTQPHLHTLGHELVHWMRREAPEVYDEFRVELRKLLDLPAFQKFGADLVRLGTPKENVGEEFMGEVVGDGFLDQRFWDALGKENPSLLAKVRDALARLIDAIKRRLQGRPIPALTRKYLFDYDRALRLAGQAMARYGARPARAEQGRGGPTAFQRGERFEAGRVLTKEQRAAVLKTLVDVYRLNRIEKVEKGMDRRGEMIMGYPHLPELFEKSDITGAMVRHYVRLPDGRIAHPTELFPDYKQSDIDREMARREHAKREAAQAVKGYLEPSKQFDSPQAAAAYWNRESEASKSRSVGGWATILPASERTLYTNGDKFVMLNPEVLKQGETVEALADQDWKPAKEPKRPTTDQTAQGEQTVIPGAERITDRALIERKAEGPAKAKRPQKDVGELPLFDEGAKKQGSLFSRVATGPGLFGNSFEYTSPQVRDELLASSALTLRNSWARLGVKWDLFRIKAQDKMLALRRAQEAVTEATGNAIPTPQDAYLGEELYHGIVGQKLDEFRTDRIEPLIKKIADSGLTIDQLNEFLYARHAPERNAQIARINEDMPEGGSGMTDAQAAEIMDRFRAAGLYDRLDQVAEDVDRITGETLDALTRGDLISAETRIQWRNTYKHYVPLRGWEAPETEAEDAAGKMRPRVGQGLDIRGSESKRAMGRESRAGDILAHVMAQHEEAVVRAGKNQVAKQFLRLVEANPNEELWKVGVDTAIRRIDKTTGMVTTGTNPDLVNRDNVLAAKIGGEVHYVTINDPGLARAMKNLGVESIGGMTRALGSVMRWLARINTQWNPAFAIPNLFRDVQTAMVNIQAEDVPDKGKLAAAIVRDIPKAMRGAFGGSRGMVSSEWQKAYREFAESGGKISFFGMEDIETRAKKLRNMLGDAANGNAVRTGLRYAGQLLSDLNSAVENATRLSVYANLRRRGIPQAKAASIARNLTVNFNRKGEWGTALNSLYLFYNAAIQGNAQMVRAIAKSRRVKGIVLTSMVVGALLDSLMAALSPEDDETGEKLWDQIGEHDKAHNLIIINPWAKKKDELIAAKIPLPYGYNIFPYTGLKVSELLRGKPSATVTQAATDTVGAAFDAFNPLGSSGPFWYLPTLAKPVAEIEANTTFTGAPMMPDKESFGQTKPDSELYFKSARVPSIEVARQINELAGGSAYREGFVSWSPETLDHWFDFATGGLGKFLMAPADAALRLKQSDKQSPLDWPIVSRFTVTRKDWYADRRFRELNDAVVGVRKTIEAAEEAKDRETVREWRRRFPVEWAVAPMFKDAQRRLTAMYRSTPKEQRDSKFEARVREIENEAIKAYIKALEKHRKQH